MIYPFCTVWFPQELKVAKGNSNLQIGRSHSYKKNYWPDSVLPLFSKLYESIVYNRKQKTKFYWQTQNFISMSIWLQGKTQHSKRFKGGVKWPLFIGKKFKTNSLTGRNICLLTFFHLSGPSTEKYNRTRQNEKLSVPLLTKEHL